MRQKIGLAFIIAFAILTGFYPSIYFIIDRNFGLLSSKPDHILKSVVWNICFYTHIITGAIALLIGWLQFLNTFRNKYIKIHRLIGLIYLFSVMASGISGIYIGIFATSGIIAASGFIILGIIWLYTTVHAFLVIRQNNRRMHQLLMTYSYAATCAAITLRIWLPLLLLLLGDFYIAYPIVAWLCWVPNLAFAYYLSKGQRII
jgi:uncharacterized membrane protein